MNSQHPKVIACLPSYNAEQFIEKTLCCLQRQSYPNFEVLISDDCSRDNTVHVIQSAIKDDERFHLIQQSKNLGWVDNINLLMEKAVEMGKYVFIMPHDDQIVPEYIEKLTDALEKNPNAATAFGDMKLTSVTERTEIIRYDEVRGIQDRVERTKSILRLKGIWTTAWRGVSRSEAVKKIIPLKKNVAGTRDCILDWIWLVKLSLGGEFITVPEVLYSKHFRKTSASVQWHETNQNYLGSFFSCSFVLFRCSISWREQLIFQSIIYELIAKRIVIGTGLYSLFQRVKFLLQKKSRQVHKS